MGSSVTFSSESRLVNDFILKICLIFGDNIIETDRAYGTDYFIVGKDYIIPVCSDFKSSVIIDKVIYNKNGFYRSSVLRENTYLEFPAEILENIKHNNESIGIIYTNKYWHEVQTENRKFLRRVVE